MKFFILTRISPRKILPRFAKLSSTCSYSPFGTLGMSTLFSNFDDKICCNMSFALNVSLNLWGSVWSISIFSRHWHCTRGMSFWLVTLVPMHRVYLKRILSSLLIDCISTMWLGSCTIDYLELMSKFYKQTTIDNFFSIACTNQVPFCDQCYELCEESVHNVWEALQSGTWSYRTTEGYDCSEGLWSKR